MPGEDTPESESSGWLELLCWEWDYGNAVGYNGEAGCYYKSSMVAECGGSTQEKTGLIKGILSGSVPLTLLPGVP